MIELYVEPYCHDCPEFEVSISYTALPNHHIICKHRNRCKAMLEYLKKKASEQSAN
jgi:hypothetical protein